MTTGDRNASTEREIRQLIDNGAEAIRAKHVDGSLSNYAPDVLSFDVVNPLQASGLDALRKRLEEWLASFQGPIDYELRDVTLTAGDDVAFSHSLNRVNATRLDGTSIDTWWRPTVGYRKTGGTWTIAHVHNSVPMDIETGRASVDLQP